MNSREELFTHSVARFGSSFPLSVLQSWSNRHSYDLALALNQAATVILGHPVAFLALSFRTPSHTKELFLTIEIDGAPFDIFGTNVLVRIEEAAFDELGIVNQERLHSMDNLLALLARQDFFLNYWPPEQCFSSLVLDGILSAAQELSVI